ncbi:hypothetical protein SLEP1_g22483 [Rubroshorea leprosula]|uniref:Secreted protein n=1 Tax=Rubroshorea leprosula TaxID=152421 RepID=A0AAV5JIQ1_9ROSI|nr:hypothetical protein SLEP1_g22483 [Rubroshorea leprosula]
MFQRGVLGALASCTLRPTLSLLLGHVILVSKRVHRKARNKLTWPNEKGSVAGECTRRVPLALLMFPKEH